MQTPPGCSKWSAGFSFIDLMSVLILTSILVSLALPSLTGPLRDYRLQESADELVGDLNRARTLAVSQGAVYQVQFSSSQNSYSIVNVTDGQQVTPVTRTLGSEPLLIAVPSQPILFSTRGLARGGTIVMASTGGETIRVEVAPSGKTTVSGMESAHATPAFPGEPDYWPGK